MAGTDLDSTLFLDNLDANWPEAFAKYPYEHVAWSTDGTRVLAHSPSIDGLIDELDRLGISEYVADYLVPGDDFGFNPRLDSGSVTAAETCTERRA